MSQLHFLTHSQLHEVLFDFLDAKEILNYRSIHSTCDALVLHSARSQLQDVIGQDISLQSTDYSIGSMTGMVPRTIEAVLVTLLVRCGEDLGRLLSTSEAGAHSIGRQLLRGKSQRQVDKTLQLLCSVMTEDSVRTLVFIDASRLKAKDTSATPKHSLFFHHITSRCSPLVSLSVRETRGIVTDDAMKLVAANCRQLRFLDVSWTYGAITDESMKSIATNCNELHSLHVANTKGVISDESISLLATHCRQLRVLDVSGTEGTITDESMTLLVANCVQLRSLDVSSTEGEITDATITLVATHCRHLLSLNVANNWGLISDASMKLVGVNCPQLQTLDVSNSNAAITDECITLLAANCLQLKSLNVRYSGCQITDASMKIAVICKT